MTPDDVRAAAERVVHFHDRFAPLKTAGVTGHPLRPAKSCIRL
jgi:hypothetical protein